MAINILLILAGLFLLQQGASWFVNGSSGLARRLHVSELAIGLTIVAFGTSAPELVVNGFASFRGNQEYVFGNIIGSNIFNLFVILSIVGLITPLKVKSSTAWREIPFSFLALLLLFILVSDHFIFKGRPDQLGRIDALILFTGFVLFLFYAFRNLKSDTEAEQISEESMKSPKIILLILAGLAGLILGGKLVLDNAEKIATELGMSDKLIGLFILAPGTSLPELATSVVAALKKNNDIAVGNIIGSNIFNILFILSVSATIRPLPYNGDFNIDMAFLALGTIILFLAMYTGGRKQIDRWEAFILLISYLAYSFWLFKN